MKPVTHGSQQMKREKSQDFSLENYFSRGGLELQWFKIEFLFSRNRNSPAEKNLSFQSIY
jgi:hypothetical protein